MRSDRAIECPANALRATLVEASAIGTGHRGLDEMYCKG